MKRYLLYGLYCPDTDNIKYIGITTNSLLKRLNSHLRKPTNHLTKKWFAELKNKSRKPLIKVIKECQSYEDLLKSEIEEIKKLRNNNVELFNIADGGDINPMYGKTHTEEARKKISGRKKGISMNEEQKKIHRERLKKLWMNPEWSKKTINKMIESRNGNFIGKDNPNWKGGPTYCQCGKIINKKSKSCIKCRDTCGVKNPFFGRNHDNRTIEKLKSKCDISGENNPNFKYPITENELRELYIIQNRTIKEISEIFNCCINTVNNNLRKYDIFKPKTNIYNLNYEKIIQLRKDGLNLVEIGNIYGCSNKIIHKFLKKK